MKIETLSDIPNGGLRFQVKAIFPSCYGIKVETKLPQDFELQPPSVEENERNKSAL